MVQAILLFIYFQSAPCLFVRYKKTSVNGTSRRNLLQGYYCTSNQYSKASPFILLSSGSGESSPPSYPSP